MPSNCKKEMQLKRRITYTGIILVIIVLGICSRKFAAHLPDFVARHAGDALWASVVYLSVRTCFIKKSITFATVVSLLFCYMIECSQFYQAPWILYLRQTMLGALVLGHSFLTVDLLRYAIGIILTLVIEKYFLNYSTHSHLA